MDLPDIHAKHPHYGHHLTRVGIRRVKKPVEVCRPVGTVSLHPVIDIFVDLPAEQKGSHMSRNAEMLEEIIERSCADNVVSLEDLSLYMCTLLLERHLYATYAEARLEADYFLKRDLPSGRTSMENFTIISRGQRWKDGRAVKSVGIEVLGTSACPCAMEAVRTILEDESPPLKQCPDIPVITHNQRNRTRLMLEVPESSAVEVNDLIDIVESSLSAPTFGILKRRDEAELVLRAHLNPKFVEDVVRDTLKQVIDRYQDLPDETWVQVWSESEESIHKHNAFAERETTLGELRKERMVQEEHQG